MTAPTNQPPPWFRVDRRIVDALGTLSAPAVKVYLALASMADIDNGKCWPKQGTLAKLVGMTERAVRKGVAELEEAGLIDRERQYGRAGVAIANLYTVRTPQEHPEQMFRLPGTHVPVDPEHTFRVPGTHVPDRNESQLNESQQNESQLKKGRKAAGDVPIPEKLDSEKFRAAWSNWLAYRRERKLTLTERTLTAQLAKLAEWGQDDAIASIEASISNGWQGLFQRKERTNGRIHQIGPGQRFDPAVPICHRF